MVHYDRLHFTLLAIIFVLVYILASQAFLPKTSTESSTTPSPTTPSPVEDFPTSSSNPVFTSPEACPSSTVVLPEGLKGKLWYEENFFLLAAKNISTDKVGHHNYEVIYDRYLRPYRDRKTPFKLLEIGLGCGMANGAYRGYQLFTSYAPNVAYYGLDLQKSKCVKLLNTASYLTSRQRDYLHTHTLFGSQDDSAVLEEVMQKFGPFDVIVDDGSHYPQHQIASFRKLFVDERALVPGGVYVVEDMQTNFSPKWGGTKERQEAGMTFVQFVRDMILDLSFRWWDLEKKPWFNKMHYTYIHRPEVKWVRSIDCDKEICAFVKNLKKMIVPGEEEQ